MNSPSHNILVIPSWFPTKESPLAGIFFFEQSEALCTLYDIKILIIREYHFRSILSLFKLYGVEYINENGYLQIIINKINIIPFFPFSFLNNIILNFRLSIIFRKLRWKPDLIHSHSVYPGGIYANNISNKFKIPYIVTEHRTNINVLMNNQRIKERIVKTYYNANKVIAVSKGLMDEMKSFINRNILVIPNFIDVNYFKSSIKNNNGKEVLKLLFIGALEERKGLDVLIKAMGIVRDKKKNAYLKIIGEGHNKSIYVKLSEKIGVSNEISFLGFKNREEVRNYLEECDIFVLPSRKETFGVVLIEALSMGKPVIATRCGGPEYFINDKVGLIVEPDNPVELANAISNLSDNIFRYNPEELREYVKSCFSNEIISEMYNEVYKEAINT